MNQRIHNFSKWRRVEADSGLHFSGRPQRTVIIEVNCPNEARFYVRQDAEDVDSDPERVRDLEGGRGVDAVEEEMFLGVAKGRDRFEFAVDGPFDLLVEGSEAYVYSADGLDVATRIVAPEIFTRIANRRQRNPHLEMIQYQMRLNQERFEQQLRDEVERRVSALEEGKESYAPQRDIRAPDERVGKAAGRDSGTAGEPEPSAEPAYAEVDEGGSGEKPSGKRKKASASDDL